MSRRRQPEEEHENHERWLVSYADFITLLFAFFVVMYAISSLNEGKYRVLSLAIVDAFRTGSTLSVNPRPSGGANTMVEVPQTKPISKAVKSRSPLSEQARLGNLAADLNKVLNPLVKSGQVNITQTKKGVAIEVKDTALFAVGQAQLSTQSFETLRQMANVLSTVDNSVSVEGFTDNVPIRNPVFPSNWELSAARAGSVVRLFEESGISPDRLVAIGRAANQPVDSNATADGRARNRRVSITVLANTQDDERTLPAEVTSELAAPANTAPDSQNSRP
ncbi:flagellar motor protein MotD [Paludibacterium paludis]|uniref:Flagellar motor protein MotD n=1 Tax=Paludibacterium paludis TaxID=1225769 RepID=A0A918P5F5_9NEIS|nr:flagellar motor protein MotD [Paludibacterium paludis]GGY22976.1 flagellar motor protein MotD [Paludibacterium paludis]